MCWWMIQFIVPTPPPKHWCQGERQCCYLLCQRESSASLVGGLWGRVESRTSSGDCEGRMLSGACKGGEGSACGWPVDPSCGSEGGRSKAGVQRLRKRWLRTSIRPLLVLTKYLRLGPIVITVIISQSLLCWFCRATREPIWISASEWVWVF